MKHTALIFLSIITLITASAEAAESGWCPDYRDTETGIRVAYSGSHLKGDDGFDKDRRGFQINLFRRYALTPNFYFQPEVGYASKGAEVRGTRLDNTIVLDYIQAAPMFKLYFANNPGTGPYLVFGPYFAYNIVAHIKHQLATDPNETVDSDLNGNRHFDAGMTVGAGVDIGCGSYKIIADLRYEMGGVDVVDSDASHEEWFVADDESLPELKNRTFALSLGIVF